MISPLKAQSVENKMIHIVSSSGNVFSYLLKADSFDAIGFSHSTLTKKETIAAKVMEASRLERNNIPSTLEQPVVDFNTGNGFELLTFVRSSLSGTFFGKSTKI